MAYDGISGRTKRLRMRIPEDWRDYLVRAPSGEQLQFQSGQADLQAFLNLSTTIRKHHFPAYTLRRRPISVMVCLRHPFPVSRSCKQADLRFAHTTRLLLFPVRPRFLAPSPSVKHGPIDDALRLEPSKHCQLFFILHPRASKGAPPRTGLPRERKPPFRSLDIRPCSFSSLQRVPKCW